MRVAKKSNKTTSCLRHIVFDGRASAQYKSVQVSLANPFGDVNFPFSLYFTCKTI